MEERRFQDLLENLKKKATLQFPRTTNRRRRCHDDDEGVEANQPLIDDAEPVTVPTAEALDHEVYDFAVKAVKAAGIVKLGGGRRTRNG